MLIYCTQPGVSNNMGDKRWLINTSKEILFFFFQRYNGAIYQFKSPTSSPASANQRTLCCAALRQFWDVAAVEMLLDVVAPIQKRLSNSIMFVICQLALASWILLFVVRLVLIAYLHGYFLYFSYLWWRLFRQQQTGTLQKILKFHGSETPPPPPFSYCMQ